MVSNPSPEPPKYPIYNQVHQNVMEWLVAEEVENQLSQVSPRLAVYINKVEVATFALNRLPPLYASSEEGLRRQEKRAQKDYGHDIIRAVRHALAAVQRDPIRFSTPLLSQGNFDSEEAQAALEELREILPQRELSWKNLTKLVKQTVKQTKSKKSIIKSEAPTDHSEDHYAWQDRRYRR